VVSSIFAILAVLSLLAAVVLLLIPKLLHAMLRVAFFSDLFSFSIYFLTLANYKNLYQCFEAAAARTETTFFKRALVRLQLGELKSVQEAMRYLIEETRDFGYEAYEILSLALLLMGVVSPVFIVFSGVVLALYAVPAMDYEALLGRISRELPSVPVFARKVSYRLRRDMALEKALEDPTTISRAVRVKACTRTFLIEEASVLERVIYDMGEMGKKLGESLAALAKYLNESIKQKLLTAQLFRNFRLTIYLLLFFIPLIPIVSIFILKMISGYTGFEPSGSDILGGSIFFELMDRMKEVNTKAAAVSTLMVSYVTNACLAVLASFASGIYYSEKYRFYLLLSGIAFTITGLLLILVI
jgi:hypothetical protein